MNEPQSEDQEVSGLGLQASDPWYTDQRTKRLVLLLIECWDALPAITVPQARLHNIARDLDMRIKDALKPWELPPGEDGI